MDQIFQRHGTRFDRFFRPIKVDHMSVEINIDDGAAMFFDGFFKHCKKTVSSMVSVISNLLTKGYGFDLSI